MIKAVNNDRLEEYDPMTTLYWKKNKKPNIDIRDCPFALDRQLEDQKFSMLKNRVRAYIIVFITIFHASSSDVIKYT